MVHYLFTNDLRRDNWPEILSESAKLIRDDSVPSADEDKSMNNYINTQASYLCIQNGTRANDFCCRGDVQPVILNFVNRFQFPNARTKSSYSQSVDDSMSIAPLRLAVQLMYALGLSGDDQSYITYKELYNDVVLDEEVARNSVSIFSLATKIIADRENGIVLEDVPRSGQNISTEECEWIHGGRQIHELFDILKFVPFISEDTSVGGFRLSIPEISDSLLAKQFFNIVNNRDFWSAPESADWDEIRESYMKYMDEGLDMFSETDEEQVKTAISIDTLQRITYGAPGTGKSYGTDLEIKASGVDEKKDVFRTTFHPDSDYSTFVGAYKPTKEESNCDTIVQVNKIVKDQDGNESVHPELKAIRKSEITYDFVPQSFIRAYVAAWKKYVAKQGAPLTNADRVYLVIEEINRGHCAQIFGDLFQLLDRCEDGFSDYPIDADADLSKWLKKEFSGLPGGQPLPAGVTDVLEGEKMMLPPNLFIRATMNTSDQSLFPMDSAFKRRWDWKYVPISPPDKEEEPDFNDRKIVCKWKEKDTNGNDVDVVKKFDWWKFLDEFINPAIYSTTKSEDKQLGYFFVKVPNNPGEISSEKFAGKVLFYLYNDVFKDYNYPDAVFAKKDASGAYKSPKEKYLFKDFFDGKGNVKEQDVAEFLKNLGMTAE